MSLFENYLALRNMAFSVTPEQLKLLIPIERIKVFGVIMDWDLGDGIVTLISYETGDASMYLSTGGGVIGGGKYENVRAISKGFIAKAQYFLEKSFKTDTNPLPQKDYIKFYFLTNKGKFIAEEHMSNMENGSSNWLDFFEEGNKLISELRSIKK